VLVTDWLSYCQTTRVLVTNWLSNCQTTRVLVTDWLSVRPLGCWWRTGCLTVRPLGCWWRTGCLTVRPLGFLLLAYSKVLILGEEMLVTASQMAPDSLNALDLTRPQWALVESSALNSEHGAISGTQCVSVKGFCCLLNIGSRVTSRYWEQRWEGINGLPLF
jgi:hypothetical protein